VKRDGVKQGKKVTDNPSVSKIQCPVRGQKQRRGKRRDRRYGAKLKEGMNRFAL